MAGDRPQELFYNFAQAKTGDGFMTIEQSLYLAGEEVTPGQVVSGNDALSGLDDLAAAATALLGNEDGDTEHRGHLRLARETGDLAEMRGAADAIRAVCSDVAVLGTGGSSLAAQAFCALTANTGENDAPRLHFPDNLSPHGMTALLQDLPAGTSHFLVVSKSGGTPETMAQLLTSHRHWQEVHGDPDLASRFTVITEPGDRPLRRLAETLGCRILDHPTDIGGRFSAFSNVALLPAMLAGLDAGKIRQGAASVLDQAQGADDILSVPAVASVALHRHAQTKLGANITVLMAYADRLGHFTRWQQQLWGESLGKDGQGITPVGAIGPVDQHSQLQLYLDGPADKIFTILHEDLAGLGPGIEKHALYDPDIDYLCGHTIGDLVAAQTRATIETLVRHRRPVRVLRTARFDEFSLGALMMQFMLETEIWARLMGVNAYDQPAVEEGKRLARTYLGAATDK